jgi:hypothetical protein
VRKGRERGVHAFFPAQTWLLNFEDNLEEGEYTESEESDQSTSEDEDKEVVLPKKHKWNKSLEKKNSACLPSCADIIADSLRSSTTENRVYDLLSGWPLYNRLGLLHSSVQCHTCKRAHGDEQNTAGTL